MILKLHKKRISRKQAMNGSSLPTCRNALKMFSKELFGLGGKVEMILLLLLFGIAKLQHEKSSLNTSIPLSPFLV